MDKISPRQRFWHIATWPTRRAPAALLALTARWLPPPLRAASSSHWVVMGHPFRSYSEHLVAVARRPLRDMYAAPTVEELADLLTVAVQLASDRGIGRPSLVSNVGAFQSVGQLHFHLVPGDEFASLAMRRLAFGASCLSASAAAISTLAQQALEASRSRALSGPASRLFLLDLDGKAAHPTVAVEIGGARRA